MTLDGFSDTHIWVSLFASAVTYVIVASVLRARGDRKRDAWNRRR